MRDNLPLVPIGNLTAEPIFWSDKKRPFFGLPWSLTRYTLYADRLIIRRGLLITRQEEIRLYRIADFNVRQSIFQRIFGLGTVIIYAVDCSAPKFLLVSIRQPYEVARVLSFCAENERRRIGVGFYEALHMQQ